MSGGEGNQMAGLVVSGVHVGSLDPSSSSSPPQVDIGSQVCLQTRKQTNVSVVLIIIIVK